MSSENRGVVAFTGDTDQAFRDHVRETLETSEFIKTEKGSNQIVFMEEDDADL